MAFEFTLDSALDKLQRALYPHAEPILPVSSFLFTISTAANSILSAQNLGLVGLSPFASPVVSVVLCTVNIASGIISALALSTLLTIEKDEFEQETSDKPNLHKLLAKAQGKNPEAQFLLGLQLEKNKEFSDDWLKWLKLAADQNHLPAKEVIAKYYYNKATDYVESSGALPDVNEAAHLYRFAAEAGHLEAQYQLGILLMESGNPKSQEEALKWLGEASLCNHNPSIHAIGNYYAKLDGDENKRKAALVIEKAAKNDYAPAQYALGKYYEGGIGVEANPKEAHRWMLRASDLGLVEATLQLADHYYSGVGCEVNHERAFELYKEAVILGSQEANDRIGSRFPNEDIEPSILEREY